MTDVADFIRLEENGEDLVDFEEDKPDEMPSQPPQVCVPKPDTEPYRRTLHRVWKRRCRARLAGRTLLACRACLRSQMHDD